MTRSYAFLALLKLAGLRSSAVSLPRCHGWVRLSNQVTLLKCLQDTGFLPSCGTITHSQMPSGPGVRIDGYNLFAGAEITPHYDPMLFKCIVRGNDLDSATAKMLGALKSTQIEGVETNIDLLRRTLQDHRFSKQEFFTRSLDSDAISTKPKETTPEAATQKLITFFAESLINGTQIQGQIVCRTSIVSSLITKLTFTREGLSLSDHWSCLV